MGRDLFCLIKARFPIMCLSAGELDLPPLAGFLRKVQLSNRPAGRGLKAPFGFSVVKLSLHGFLSELVPTPLGPCIC